MIHIGPLEVHLDMREVCIGGAAVHIGSRAFDILELLIRAEGNLLSKDEIIKRVWPSTIVEENNLQVHISALRKLLGDSRDLIRTVPGRGYRMLRAERARSVSFPIVPTVAVTSAPPGTNALSGVESAQACVAQHNLPAWGGDLIGRDEAIRTITAMLASARHVTLVGAGGMGKTRLSIEVARGLFDDFPDGIYWLNLAAVSDADAVLHECLKVTGNKALSGSDAIDQLTGRFAGRRALFLFDNCEHVLAAVAQLTQALLRGSGAVRVLATSRESLHTADELLYPVAPLTTPPWMPTSQPTSHAVSQFTAVTLFLARAKASNPAFVSDPASTAVIGTICHQLDGMPLAIELAAARAAVLGVREVASDLSDRFRTLTGGHRTALPRHQTLKATLDWSHGLLSDVERIVLRRLGIFVDGFSLGAAKAVVCDQEIDAEAMVMALSGLVKKSLLAYVQTGIDLRYRLLETTRAYALQKLDDNGEYRRIGIRHADFLCHFLENQIGVCAQGHPHADLRTEAADRSPISPDLPVWDAEIGNIQSALSWSFGAMGDRDSAIALAAACVSLFFDASMVNACCEWARKGLDAVAQRAGSNVQHTSALGSGHDDQHLRLLAALAAGLVYTVGPTQETRDLWARTVTMAMALRNSDVEARAIWGLWNAAQYGGRAREALQYAQRFGALAERTGNETNLTLADRLEGIALHFCGDQLAAQRRLEAMLGRYDISRHQLRLLGGSIDHRVVGQATLARIYWLRGRHSEGLQLAVTALHRAQAQQHDMAAAYVVVEALIPLHMLSGHVEEARRFNEVLKTLAARSGFKIWQAAAACFEAVLDLSEDGSLARLAASRTAFADLNKVGFLAHQTLLKSFLAQMLAHDGARDCGVAQINTLLDTCQETGEAWYSSELWRIKGEMILSSDEDQGFPALNHREARTCFMQAMSIAQAQHADTFYTRAAHSMARLQERTRRHLEIAPIPPTWGAKKSARSTLKIGEDLLWRIKSDQIAQHDQQEPDDGQ